MFHFTGGVFVRMSSSVCKCVCVHVCVFRCYTRLVYPVTYYKACPVKTEAVN